MRPLRGRKAVRITTAGFQPAVMMQYSVSDALALSAKAESLASNARFLDEPSDFVDETALPSSRHFDLRYKNFLSQLVATLFFCLIYITIIRNENPNEKCATVRCFYEGIFIWIALRARTDGAVRAEGKACFSLCRVAREEDECHIRTKIRTKILNH